MTPASILREDSELARWLDPARTESAARVARAHVACLPKGEFSPCDAPPDRRGTFGFLILDGLLLRGVAVHRRPSLEVLGPGDVIRPFESDRDPYAMVPGDVRWWALRPTRLAVLDAGFLRRMSDYPEVIAELAGRLSRASAAGSIRLAIVQQPRLSVRLHFMLWHLADRFGRVQADGVVLPLPLCHGLLAWLTGSRRPAVSRAINELERAGRLARLPDETWWLGGEPLEAFEGASIAKEFAAA